MAEYTFQVQRSDDEGDSWSPISEPQTIDDVTDIHWSLDFMADDLRPEGLPEGASWRIAAWEGADATADPDFTSESWAADPPETAAADQLPEELSPERLLAELEEIRGMREALEERRDLVIRVLMKTSTKVPRARIAAAAGVKEARLYQIRDGRL